MTNKISSVETRFDGKKYTIRTDEEKIRIVNEIIEMGCKPEEILELFGIHPTQFYSWRVKFLGKSQRPHKPSNTTKVFTIRTDEEKIDLVQKIHSSGCNVNHIHKLFGIHKGVYYTWKNKYFPELHTTPPKVKSVKPETVVTKPETGVTKSLRFSFVIPTEDIDVFFQDNRRELDKIDNSVKTLYDRWKERDTISRIKSKIDGVILLELSNKTGLTRGEITSFLDRKTDLPFSMVDKICKHINVSIV